MSNHYFIRYNVSAIIISVAMAFVALLLATSCSPRKNSDNIPIATEIVLNANQLQHGVKGDTLYAQVNSEWLLEYWKEWNHSLFQSGITQYDPKRFDCNRYAQKFAADVHIEFNNRQFHSYSKANALALSFIFYTQQKWLDVLKAGRLGQIGVGFNGVVYFIEDKTGNVSWNKSPGHSIVQVETEKGTLFLEPQTGKYIVLTKDEQDSICVRVW